MEVVSGAYSSISVKGNLQYAGVPVPTSLELDVCDGAGSQFTGTAINPARALGPAIVFHCHWNVIWLYVIAGMFAAAFPAVTQDLLSLKTCCH